MKESSLPHKANPYEKGTERKIHQDVTWVLIRLTKLIPMKRELKVVIPKAADRTVQLSQS